MHMRRRRTGFAMVVGAAALVAACSAGGSHRTSTARATSPTSSVPATTAPIAGDLASAGTIRATIAAGPPLQDAKDSYGIAADDTDVWVYNGEDGALSRIATSTNTVVATMKLAPGCLAGQGCGNLTIGSGALWVANEQEGSIIRVDTTTNKVAGTIPLGEGAGPQVYASPGAIWSANYSHRTYSRIDPATNKISTTLPDHGGAESVVFGFGSIWLCDAGGPRALTRLDATTLQVQAQIDLSHGGTTFVCLASAATDQSILVGAVSTVDDTTLIERVDPTTDQVTDAVSAPGSAGAGLVATPTQGWAVDTGLGLFGLDPRTARPRSHLSIPSPAGVATGAGSVWVVSASGSVYRVAPSA